VINCPHCGVKHMDTEKFAERLHHTHLCVGGCGKSFDNVQKSIGNPLAALDLSLVTIGNQNKLQLAWPSTPTSSNDPSDRQTESFSFGMASLDKAVLGATGTARVLTMVGEQPAVESETMSTSLGNGDSIVQRELDALRREREQMREQMREEREVMRL
jgi:hypothetical protein